VAKISDFGSCVHIDHEYHLSLKVQQTGRSRASHEYSNRGTRNKDLQHLFLNTMKNSNIHERKSASVMGRGVLTGTCLYFCIRICVNVWIYICIY
jgi:hypothetical protein